MQANSLTDRTTDVAYRSADAGQKRIAAFRADGRQLFFPNASKN
jgi:ABC-type tungstate transport system permease subunit